MNNGPDGRLFAYTSGYTKKKQAHREAGTNDSSCFCVHSNTLQTSKSKSKKNNRASSALFLYFSILPVFELYSRSIVIFQNTRSHHIRPSNDDDYPHRPCGHQTASTRRRASEPEEGQERQEEKEEGQERQEEKKATERRRREQELFEKKQDDEDRTWYHYTDYNTNNHTKERRSSSEGLAPYHHQVTLVYGHRYGWCV